MIDQRRISFAKDTVPFLRSQAHVINYTLLVGYKGIFGENTKKALEFWHFVVQLFLVDF